MKLTTNNFQFIKMKWFFSLFLGIIISLFTVLPVEAIDVQICVPVADNCYAYTGVDSACVNSNGCQYVLRTVTIGDSYPTGYKLCASLNDPKKCYTFSASKCPANNCKGITLPNIGTTGSANPVIAGNTDPVATIGNANPVSTIGNADPVGYSEDLNNPLGIKNVNSLIGRAINSLMGIVGALALLMFVYGGLVWMTSSGSQDKVKKGKDIMLWAAVGLVIIFSAYGLTKFVINIATK